MREITITYTTPELVVNGLTFPVLRSDAEMMDDVAKIDAELSAVEGGVAAALAKKENALTAYIGTLLGKDAMRQIAGSIKGLPKGRGLGLSATVQLCEKLIADAGRAYAEAFAIRYGDE